ncbi:sugar porter family MFS transporter [Aeromonas jandaei]
MNMSTNILSITLIVALGGLLFGYDTAVISGANEALRAYFSLSPAELGFAVSSTLIGCVLGAVIAGKISDNLGRKKALLIASVLFFLSAIGTAVPDSITVFILFRILGGVGVGIASIVSPMYIAEIAPSNKRGALVSCNQFCIILGMLVVYFVNYYIALLGSELWLNSIGWRYMFASMTIPASAFFLLMFLVPDTPRWLLMNGRVEEAKKIVSSINKTEESFQREWSEIERSLKQPVKTTSSEEQTSFSRLMKHKYLLFCGILLAVLQQATGINVFLYYAPTILKDLSEGGMDIALLLTIVIGIVNVTSTVVAIMKIDKWGRKPLMISGALVMGISMFALGTGAYTNNIGMYMFVFILTYIAAFAVSLGPVTWVLISEIFPSHIRSQAISLCVFLLWIANFIVSQTFPMMNDANSWLYKEFNGGFPFWLYGAMCFITILVVYKMLPETKGKSLEEVESIVTFRH